MKFSSKKILFALLLSSVQLPLIAQLASVDLSLPDSFGKRGNTYAYPVYCNSTLTVIDSILSGQFTVNHNGNVMDVVNFDTIGTLLSGSTVLFNSGNQSVAFSKAQPITGTGILVYLLIKIKDNAYGTSSVDLTNAMFNEGSPALNIVSGTIRPMDIFISPKYLPSNLVIGDTVAFSVSGDIHPPVQWATTDTHIVQINPSTGVMVGKNIGQTSITVTDAIGLYDQTETFTIFPKSLKNLTLTIHDTSITQNLVFDLPIYISDVTSLGILSAQFSLSYSSSVLIPQGIITTGSLSNGWTPVVNYQTGKIVVAMAGVDTLKGSGIFTFIRFKVQRNATSGTSINLSSVLFNENIPAGTVNGYFSPLIGPKITISGIQTKMIGGETATLSASGGTSPYKWKIISDTTIAVIDSITGVLKTKSRGYAKFTAVDKNGFDGIDSLLVHDFRASIPDTVLKYNDSVDVPLQFTSVSGFAILSTQFELEYDTSKIFLSSVIQSGTMSSGMTMEYNNVGGKVTFAMSGISPLSGSGTFLKLRFKPKSIQSSNSSTLLHFVKFDANEGGSSYRLAATIDGSVSVANILPVFTAKLRDTTINENQLLSFPYKGSDLNGDPLTFSFITSSAGMSITTAGVFTWTPNFSQAGQHKVVVQVSDSKPNGIVKDSAIITVVNVNRAPTLIRVMPDTSIYSNTSLQYQYEGFDPDGQSIQFNLIEGPAGSTITTTGMFTWTPAPSQTGNFRIIVGITDNALTTRDTAFLTVTTVNTVNRPPYFTSVPQDFSLGIDSLFVFQYSASDSDNNTLRFSFAKSRNGAFLDSITGIFTWTPHPADLGVDTFVISVSDGFVSIEDTVFITVFGFPVLQFSQNTLNFGVKGIGVTDTLSAEIMNNGYLPLLLNSLSLSLADMNFTFDSSSIKIIQPGEQKSFSIIFTPITVGEHQALFTFRTNDPHWPLFSITAQGISISKAALTKKILIDTLHNSTIPVTDSTIGMTQLFSALKNSGMTVSFTESGLNPSGYDAVLLVTPQTNYSIAEKAAIKQFVTNGGLLVLMGNASNENGSNASLNDLLSDTSWTTGIMLSDNIVADSTNNYLEYPQYPVITQFTDPSHPYLRSIDSLVMFGASSVLVANSGIPFARFTNPAVEVTGGVTQAAIALSNIGKGKILTFGDASLWQNGMQSYMQEIKYDIDAKDNLALALNIFSVTEDYEVNMPSATPNEVYQLISVPFDLKNADIETNLKKSLGNVNPLVWRLFGKYNPVSKTYVEFPHEKLSMFHRGEGYFLITRGHFNLNFGHTTILPVEGYYPIRIGPGYSMIGNPFPYRVSWANSLKGDSVQTVLYWFNPAKKDFDPETQTLEKFTGYFVKNLSHDSVTIYINPLEVAPLAKQDLVFSHSESEWGITIGATSGKAFDNNNYAGISRLASVELDKLDAAEPPTIPTDYIMVRFTNPTWKNQPGTYAVDMRPLTETGVFWDLDVSTAKKKSPVSLSLESVGDLPSDFLIYLIDKRTERAVRVDHMNTYDFTMNSNENQREFRLIAGKKEFVENNTNGIPLVPQNFALGQNYPNPFNPTTTIQYTVGHTGNVSLVIYNLLGQKVRTLINNLHNIGSYEVMWDAKDDRGTIVSTGIYFCKFSVMSQGERIYDETKKMVLLK